jgi:hypothetical protein
VSSLHENLADSWLLRLLVGTPFVPLYFRSLGARIGRRVCMESTWLTEFDLVKIGDEAQLNSDCTIQTHLFEDRVMKMDHIHIGAGCSVGMDSVVLYSSRMEARSVLGDLSLLMKGETLPEGTRWEGSPARPSRCMPSPVQPPGTAPILRRGEVRLIIQPGALPMSIPAELEGHLFALGPDVHGRPRAQDEAGQSLSISWSRSPGVRVFAMATEGRIGVDVERSRPSSALGAASELFLPVERAWAEGLPGPVRWRALLMLWTAKEAVLKALGQGLCFGMDQIELGPDGSGGILLRRLCGSERLAQGWGIYFQECRVEGRDYLAAVARVPSTLSE